MNHSLSKRLVAEAFGTGLLAVSAVGSAAMAGAMTDVAALVVLCVAISCSAALYVLLELLGPISGGHLNPAVSLAMLLQGKILRNEAAAYVCMQTVGGVLGVVFVHVTFGYRCSLLAFTYEPDFPSGSPRQRLRLASYSRPSLGLGFAPTLYPPSSVSTSCQLRFLRRAPSRTRRRR